MEQPLQQKKVYTGEIIEPPWKGDPHLAIQVMGGIQRYAEYYGLSLPMCDYFYPKNQCPQIDGMSAELWWEKYVGGPLHEIIEFGCDTKSERQIREYLGWSVEEFNEWWKDLPADERMYYRTALMT